MNLLQKKRAIKEVDGDDIKFVLDKLRDHPGEIEFSREVTKNLTMEELIGAFLKLSSEVDLDELN